MISQVNKTVANKGGVFQNPLPFVKIEWQRLLCTCSWPSAIDTTNCQVGLPVDTGMLMGGQLEAAAAAFLV